MKRIRMFDPRLTLGDAWSVARCMLQRRIGPGPAVAELERRFGAWKGCDAVAVNSGTTALLLALWALNLPREQLPSIAFPAYTMIAGANATRLLSASVVLIDVYRGTWCMRTECLGEHVKNGAVSAAIYVDHNGSSNGCWGAAAACRRRGIPIIEDACQSVGTPDAGTYGDMGCFSFSPPKCLTGGQGGMVITRNPLYAARLRELVDQGGGDWRKTRVHTAIGGNFRMTDIQATLVLRQFDRLPKILASRERLHQVYRDGGINVPQHAWCVTVESPDAPALVRHLNALGIDSAMYYQAVHRCPPYADGKSYPNAEYAADHLVYLPSGPCVTKSDVRRICNAVKSFTSHA